MANQSVRLWSVKYEARGTRTVNQYQCLWILGDDSEVVSRKAKRFLKKDGGINIRITTVEQHGTVDVF